MILLYYLDTTLGWLLGTLERVLQNILSFGQYHKHAHKHESVKYEQHRLILPYQADNMNICGLVS